MDQIPIEEQNQIQTEPKKPQERVYLIAIIIILSVLLIGLSAYLYVIFSGIRHNEGGLDNVEKYNTNPKVIEKEEELLNNNVETETEEDNLNTEDTSLTTYVNTALGFSIDIPKTAVSISGSCEWVDDETSPSYRPKNGYVPITTFETDNGVYIAYEYSYELLDRQTSNGHTTFGRCEKKENTVSLLQTERRTWHIVSQEVNNDNELTEFIKSRFGSGCSIKEKRQSSQPGIYDVLVESDGLDMEYSSCILNYMYVLKYSPQNQKVYQFDRGQSAAFPQKLDYSQVYDDAMEDSFKVLSLN